FLSVSAFAAGSGKSSTSEQQYVNYSEDISEGFRLSFVKSFMTGKISSGSDSISGDVDQNFGLAAGYASIKPEAIGWMADLEYDFLGSKSVSNLVLEADVTYGFEKIGYAFGGLNLSKLNGLPGGISSTPGPGFQIGVGANVTKNFGADLAYVLQT